MTDHDNALVLSRVIDVPRPLVWKVWTNPEHLMQWWCPKPYQTISCRMDLKPGGEFFTHMVGPDNFDMANAGCFLEIVPEHKIAFTDCLKPGYVPSESGFFSAVITLENEDGGTRYTARAMHKNAADRQKHEEMGFHEGWGTALDQLVAYAKSLG